MRVAIRIITRKLHHLQQSFAYCVLFGSLYFLKIQEWFADNVTDCHLRIKGKRRILKHHLDMLTALSELLAS